MSILIKGMKMPPNCAECPCGQNELFCWKTGSEFADDFVNERLPDCPLVEVPVPHGRLIDADALNTYDVSPIYEFCVMGVTEEDIGLAPTIIEAEGETDGR